MARLEEYRASIQRLLQDYAQLGGDEPDVETEVICDTQGDHYQLVYVGWRHDRRIYGCVLHLDIKGGKVWVQHNGTEADVAQELVALGVPQSDIVLGFHSPFKRQFTGYGVG